MIDAALSPEDTEHSTTQKNKKEKYLNSIRDLIAPGSIILDLDSPIS